MKSIPVILFILISSVACTESIELGHFTKEDLSGGQSGCWYYYPANKKQLGNVIGLGKSADDAIYLIINGEKKMIANWKPDYQKEYHAISYSSPEYNVNIHSKVLSESRHSSQYEATLTITTKSTQKTVEVFGECGS